MKLTIDSRDTVATVKSKLSKSFSISGRDIGLVFQNVILYDDKVISDYKISPDRFVLWFINDDDSICSSQTGRSGVVQFQYFNVKDWTLTSLDRNTRSFSIRQVTNLSGIIDGISSRLNCPRDSIELFQDIDKNKIIKTSEDFIDLSLNGDVIYFSTDKELIEVLLRNNDGIIIRATVSRDDQICVLAGHLRNIDQYNDEIEYQRILDKYKTFRYYNIQSRDIIDVTHKMRGGGPTISLSDGPNLIQLVPLHPNIDLLYVDKSDNLSNIITAMSNHLHYPTSQIKLFQDKSRTSPIQTDEHLHQVIQTNLKQIYFSIGILHLKNNFTKHELLGSGAFGVVHRYREIGSNKDFAVKKLLISRSNADKLMNEITVLSKFGCHTGIVQFVEYIKTDNALYIVMDYMSGGSLGSYIRNHGPLMESQILENSKQVLEALKHLHDNQILHRDIKCENILLDTNCNAKLGDFGLAKNLQNLASLNFLNGAIQSFVGTAYWMAPEVINNEPYGLGADIWSFGAALVEMVTGNHPFYGLNEYKAMNIICTEKKITFSCPPNISEKVINLIESCLQPDPLQRPACDKLMEQI